MPTTLEERVALAMVSRLEAITTGNGYAFTASSVDRVNRDSSGWTPKNNSIVLVQLDAARNDDHDRPGNPPAKAYELTFVVYGFIRQSDRATTADASRVNDMRASIIKAVCNSSNWHQFDSVSYDAEVGTASNFTSDSGDHAGCSVEFIVRYRVGEIDPYTVRS